MRLATCTALAFLGLVVTGSEAFAQTRPQADLIVVVDTSGSMTEEVNELQGSINDFVSVMQASADVRVILIAADSSASLGVCVPAPLGSGSCPSDEALPGYRHVTHPVGSRDALSA